MRVDIYIVCIYMYSEYMLTPGKYTTIVYIVCTNQSSVLCTHPMQTDQCTSPHILSPFSTGVSPLTAPQSTPDKSPKPKIGRTTAP